MIFSVLLFAAASLVHGACDVGRSTNVCLSADLNQCKSNASGDAAKCACVTTAQACITTAGCDKDVSILGALQLAYSAMAQTCEMPESTALPSAGGVCSITGQTFCLSAVNWCARINRGTGFPQPAVCNGCIDTLSACLNKYACVDAYAQQAFKLSGMAFQCGDVSARFNATVSVGGTTTAATGITLPSSGSGSTSSSTTTVAAGVSSTITVTTESAASSAIGSTTAVSQGSSASNNSGSTTNAESESTSTSTASHIMFAGIASVAVSIVAIVA